MASDDAAQLRAFERAAHTRIASSYDAFFSPVTALATSALLDAAVVGPGSQVLDVACGPGRVAAEAVARGAVAVGVDLAPGMIALADRGHDLRLIQDYLGHRDPRHTVHYTRTAGRRFEGLWGR